MWQVFGRKSQKRLRHSIAMLAQSRLKQFHQRLKVRFRNMLQLVTSPLNFWKRSKQRKRWTCPKVKRQTQLRSLHFLALGTTSQRVIWKSSNASLNNDKKRKRISRIIEGSFSAFRLTR